MLAGWSQSSIVPVEENLIFFIIFWFICEIFYAPRTKLEDIRAVQKQRARQKGVSAASLALGKKVDKAEEITDVR